MSINPARSDGQNAKTLGCHARHLIDDVIAIIFTKSLALRPEGGASRENPFQSAFLNAKQAVGILLLCAFSIDNAHTLDRAVEREFGNE